MSTRQIHFSDYARRPRETTKAIVLPPPAKGGDAFLNEVLKTATSGQVHRNPLEWVGATLLHTAIVLALIIIPLYTTEAIHMANYDAVPLVAPPPPPPPPPPAGGPVAPHVTHVHPKVTYDMNKLVAPTKIPKKIATGGASEQQVAPDLAGVEGGVPGGQVGGVLGGVVGGVGDAPPPPPPAKRAQPVSKIVRAGSLLKAPRQTLNVAPEYPPLARSAHIRGVVVVDAIIDTHGNVVQARVVSGHPLLTAAALKAVLQWKYEPTSLNGQPVSVELEVQVHFDLGS